MLQREFLLVLLFCIAFVTTSFSYTDPGDVAALKTLKKRWKNVPPNWKKSDPCGDGWVGVTCDNSSNSRVTNLTLYSMNIKGTLGKEIGDLTQLQLLDLSSNPKFGGTLPATLGNLTHLTNLKLDSCSFFGEIPVELGNLAQLEFLALNTNKFTGKIPPSLGNLSKLSWLDLADNQLSGPLPISTTDGGGLDQLLNAQHFHLNQNNFTGLIPEIFSAAMHLKHILLDRNQLKGSIPTSIGLVTTLEVIRLDNNHLTGSVPSINNLTSLNVLNLANNSLTGSLPNLTTLTRLTYLDLSNNKFDRSEAPAWLSNLKNLTTLAIESGQLYGQFPQDIFSFQQLQEVKLKNNSFNGTFDMRNNVNRSLQMVNLEFNSITSVTLSSDYINNLMLKGNPVCSIPHLSTTAYCTDMLDQNQAEYVNLSDCSNPFSGDLVLRAPFFSYPPKEYIDKLKQSLDERLKTCTPNNLFIQNYGFDDKTYFRFQIHICPVDQSYFNQSVILKCFDLNIQNYSPPPLSGPSNFESSSHPKSSKEMKYIIGIAIGGTLLGGLLVLLGVYAVRQKKRAQRERLRNDPFASWHSMGEESGEAPKLSVAKAFTYDEIKMYTNNFKEINIIGSGGYGKVYRGMLPDKQLVAIKRSKEGSMQGGLEFKTEIELLSRVHHNNLVGLTGFCFEKGERMLVYEYISNGTLRDCLSGESGIQLNWSKRLKIALDSATGLAYLHDHANPPIIHRDVKSTNILLDENLTAKVSDFGLSLFVSNSEIGHVTTHVKGTLGYLDPEYYMTQQLTGKSDVYSFGVVMLELITARPPIKNEKYIVREVKTAINKEDIQYMGLKDLIDPILINNNESLVGLDHFLDLALQCVEDEATIRPTMNEIAKEIEDIMVNGGLKINSGLSFWKKNNPTRKYSMDVASSSSSRGNINSSDFKYSGGFHFRVEAK